MRKKGKVIVNIRGQKTVFQELACQSFRSEIKRMGCVLKDESSGKIYFYLKGADNVMTALLKKVY